MDAAEVIMHEVQGNRMSMILKQIEYKVLCHSRQAAGCSDRNSLDQSGDDLDALCCTEPVHKPIMDQRI